MLHAGAHTCINPAGDPTNFLLTPSFALYAPTMPSETYTQRRRLTNNIDTAHTPEMMKKLRNRVPRPRRGQLMVIPSGRTGEGKRLREFRAGLIRHLGGSPSFTQQALIDRCVVLQGQLSAMDRKAAAEGGISQHQTKVYLAWDGALRRALIALGLTSSPAPASTSAKLPPSRGQARPPPVSHFDLALIADMSPAEAAHVYARIMRGDPA